MVDRSDKGPTLETVARRAGVSRATVSRVINGNPKVDTRIQHAVHLAIADTGYVPNRAARTLVTRRSENIALVVSGAGDAALEEDEAAEDPPMSRGPVDNHVLNDPFFGRIAAGVIGHLRTRAMHPVLMLVDSPHVRAQVVRYLRQGHADGAVLVSTHPEDPLPGELVDAGVPVSLFARPSDPISADFVDVSHYDGGAMAAQRLIDMGRTRVGCVSGPLDVPAARERLDGFRHAMARHGKGVVPHVEGNFTQDSGEVAMRDLLRDAPGLNGVFAANDLMAQGALHVLRESGSRVPEDVGVVGFDDSSAATASRPALTTIRQPVEEMAGEMTRLLLARIEDPSLEPASVIFPPSLVVRDSG